MPRALTGPRLFAAMERSTHSYAGFCKKCNGMYAASLEYEGQRGLRAFIGDIIKEGGYVERVPNETVREKLTGCTCHTADATQGTLL